MIAKLLPVIFLLVGAGAGVGAGLFLRPPPEPVAAEDGAAMEASAKETDEAEETGEDAEAGEAEDDGPPESEYVKMSNQFVIPIVEDERVSALVVLSLSVEVQVGQKATVFEHEPKVRDSFLEVLFQHASLGGFSGAFTDPKNVNDIRRALLEVAQRDLGDLAKDVLILDMARQDM